MKKDVVGMDSPGSEEEISLSKDIEKMLIDQNHQIKCSLLGLEERVAWLEKYRVDYMQVCERLAGLEEGTRKLDNDQEMLADAMCLKAERERVLEMEERMDQWKLERAELQQVNREMKERVVLLEEAGSDQHVAIAELEERVAETERMNERHEETIRMLAVRVARLEDLGTSN